MINLDKNTKVIVYGLSDVVYGGYDLKKNVPWKNLLV